MKTSTIIIALFVLTSWNVLGQSIAVSNNVEITTGGTKYGVSVGWSDKWNIEYGMFHLRAPQNSFENVEGVQYHQESLNENNFSGLYFSYPLTRGEHVDFGLMVRTGLVNVQDFKITPSVMGRLHLTDRINLNLGLGFRALSPTVNTGLKINI
ncbi:MAG: hypothetical protein RIC03_02870 [Cyclobacteriaceae bacterium]